jgi:hypothetical protein
MCLYGVNSTIRNTARGGRSGGEVREAGEEGREVEVEVEVEVEGG